jgi:glycopeptide antibiotics resistance protein
MRPLLNTIKAHISPDVFALFVWSLFGATAIPIALLRNKTISQHQKIKKMLFLSFFIISGILYASTMRVTEERYHLIVFGLLGFLTSRDNDKNSNFKLMAITTLYTLTIATLDEIFQHYLPDRVGDVRDVLFGVIGGLWGTLIYLSIHYKMNKLP